MRSDRARRLQPGRLLALVLAACLALASCSFARNDVPDDWTPAAGPPPCSSRSSAVVADLFVGTIATAIGAALGVASRDCDPRGTCLGVGAASLTVGVSLIVSARSGLRKLRRCARAEGWYEQARGTPP